MLCFLIHLLTLLSYVYAAQVITNCIDLQNMQNNLAGNYALANDIDCSSTVTWSAGAGFMPIGNNTYPFTGILNGASHRVYNMTINRPSTNYIALFGYVSGANAQIVQIGLIGVNITGNNYVGGVVGCNNNSGSITNNYVTGTVSGSSYVGGFTGYSSGTITSNYATNSVSGSSYVGGFVGYNVGAITNNYATGSVLGSNYAGGLVGYNTGSITNSYATGSTSSSSNVGGLVGYNSGPVIFAFWDTDTTGQSSSAGGIGLTTQTMQLTASFVGWDFIATWVINAGVTYPLLQALIFPPVLSNTPSNVTHYIGSLLKITIPNLFMDPNGLQLTYSAQIAGGSQLPAWLFFKPSTQTFAGTPLSGAQGVLMIQVSAYNLPSLTINDAFQLTIPDRPPIINAAFTQQIALNGQAFQFIVSDATFFDPDGDHLQLSATLQNAASLPSWLNFNAVLGIFSGTATHRGSQWINVTANDGFGGQVSTLLEIITPNTAPATTATFPNQALLSGEYFNFTIPTSIFFDLDGDPLTYSATLFGGGQLLPWLSFNTQTLMFQGTPDIDGFLVISVIASDPYNATTLLNFGVSVSTASSNSPPLLAIQVLDQTATVSQAFTLTLPANMFIDPNGDTLIYSATLEGGGPLPSWLSFNTTSLVFSGTSPSTGSLPITVRADDGLGGFALDTFTLTITSNQNLPPLVQNPLSNQEVSVGENYQFTIPSTTFIDLNNAPLSYTAATSGNSALPHWLHFNTNTRTFSGTPSNTDTNIYSARITMIEVKASNEIGSAVTTFQLAVTGKSLAEIIINALITLASVISAAYATYRNRAFLWNTFLKKKYEKATKTIALNETFSYSFTIPGKKIKLVKALKKASFSSTNKKWRSCPKWIRFNDYQELLDDKDLPEWLHFNRNTMTISGAPTAPGDLYIYAEGFDGRYLEAFPLHCGVSQGKDVEMQQIPSLLVDD